MKKLLVVLLTILFVLTGCSNGGGGEKKEEQVYIVAQDGEPATLNPDAISDDFNYTIVQNIFPRLYKLNNAFNAIPDLATSYDVSDDALTYTFHLRDNAVWTDGEKVTSADAVYTFNEIIDKQYANANVFGFVESIEAPDDYTVVFHMSEPDGSFIANVSWYGTFILPKHVLEGTDWMTNDEFSNNPVSCGPFKFDVWNKGTDVQIVRDENYWGDAPLLDRVIFTVISDPSTMYQAWLNGEVDEISASYIPATDLDGIMADTDNYYTVTQTWPSPWYITFNLTEGPFADVKVREAVMYGVDREDVSVKATGGYKPANNHFIPDNFVDAVNDDAREADYDLEKAQQLLEEAGYTKDADGYYFECTFTVMGGFEDFCTVVADNMEKMGIKVKLDVQDYNIWYENCFDNTNFEITALGGFQGPDVLGTTRRWTTDGSVNIPRYSRAEVDELAKKAIQASSDEERNGYIREIQKYLREDVPFVLCVNYVDYSPFKNYIKGNNYVSVADGGSMEKASFSEYTYYWLDK
jgi:peptide/nickel transport system substrate-binding protein